MRVYRMENDKHLGPFNAEVPGIPHELQVIMAMVGQPHMLIEDICQDAIDHKELTEDEALAMAKHLSPEHDGIEHLKQTEVCAATSIEQLRDWFPAKLDRAMHDHGQDLHCYEVDDKFVRIGGQQCVVRRSALKGHEVPLEQANHN
jgi:hypothetical protein